MRYSLVLLLCLPLNAFANRFTRNLHRYTSANRRGMFRSPIALCIFLAAFLWPIPSSYADSFNVSTSATIFWNTLSITTDPGVTITGLSLQTKPTFVGFAAFFGTPGLSGIILPPQITSNGDTVTYSHQMGSGLAMVELDSPDRQSAEIVWSDFPPERHQGVNHLSAVPDLFFEVTGSGNLAIALDYSLTVDRSIPLLSSPSVHSGEGFAEAGLTFGSRSRGLTFTDLERLEVPNTNATLSRNGRLTAQGLVSNGAYFLNPTVSNSVVVHVPEPSSVLLLATGLALVFRMKRASRHAS